MGIDFLQSLCKIFSGRPQPVRMKRGMKSGAVLVFLCSLCTCLLPASANESTTKYLLYTVKSGIYIHRTSRVFCKFIAMYSL